MTASQLISELKTVFVNDRFQFDFKVSMYVAGDRNKELRKQMIKELTGENVPASKSGMYAVADALTAKFQQYELL